MRTYREFFATATAGKLPHAWQAILGGYEGCGNLLIRIPTGFGKTLGVLLAWLWHAVERSDSRWPRRLVICLPMRVLVEQTEKEVRSALTCLGLLWDGETDRDTGDRAVGVHVLMGGADADEWFLYPEHFAVLICTQDLGLSAVLNRGYGAPRARWPAEFGLLNQDSLWVMDEVQLMDVGLATSAQLQSFRDDDECEGRAFRLCRTWWMSAALQRDWLKKSPDTKALSGDSPLICIPSNQRRGPLWDEVSKPCRLMPCQSIAAFAGLVSEQHVARGKGKLGPTLVIVNRVESAVEVFEALRKTETLRETDIRLAHSRFREHERRAWREDFLNRTTCAPGTDRIVVATQVVEAGVDISSALLVTELAPWASLVQRFGRCARWGGQAQVIVADFGHVDDNNAAPYAMAELDAASDALIRIDDVAPLHLERFEEQHSELLPALYPYEPKHLLLRHELDELFDTTPDLSGADIDISRFIRSGEERDVRVFWAQVPGNESHPPRTRKPLRDEICAVPFLKARDWLFKSRKQDGKTIPQGLKDKKRAWVWDWLDGDWKLAEARNIYPGRTVLVDSESGGYNDSTGWSPAENEPVPAVATLRAQELVEVPCWKQDRNHQLCQGIRRRRRFNASESADAAENDETLSQTEHQYQTIAFHGRETGRLGACLAHALVPRLEQLFDIAGRWHDAGKTHAAFQASIRHASRPACEDIAKAPDAAWPCSPRNYYRMTSGECRRGFRHELASVLMLFAVLQRHAPDHAALLGPWRKFLQDAGMSPRTAIDSKQPPNALEREILGLGADDFNLLAYLICTHHGKVRVSWHASPADQASNSTTPRIRGVAEGDVVPPLRLADAAGSVHLLPASRLDLAPAAAGLNPSTGMSWTERVLGLLDRFGPFGLAWLEALLIAADRRASRMIVADPLLSGDNCNHGLETSHPALAKPAGSREASHPLAADSAQRGREHGFRTGAGEPGDAGSRARAQADSTRYVETRLGILSYTDLAPHLARRVQALEQAIEAGEFDARPLDEPLIEELHRGLCDELTPQLAGWRRHDVTVGAHTPPAHFHVPLLMHEFARDLAARIAHLPATVDEQVLEGLAFAEGRLLFIHPFADFNGRLARVFLRLLLRRLDLPWVSLLPAPDDSDAYIAALRAADLNDWQPLMEIWRNRFEEEASS